MANQGGGGNILMRDYRKGNWTVQETMVLIEAKKMDDERRTKRSSGGDPTNSEGRNRPTELRWKWVEDYCWKNGCLRSQNQCNDKWDNLMRDYKKLRDYERRLVASSEGNALSYWKLEKNERKEKNLPSNMVPQIYEALVEVVERKGSGRSQRVTGALNVVGGGSSSSANVSVAYSVVQPLNSVQPAAASLPPVVQHHHISAPTPPLPLPPPPLPPFPQPHMQPQPQAFHCSQPLPSVDSDTSEYSDSPLKRRRGGGEQGTRSGTQTTSSQQEVIGSAISKSASIIADALQACRESEERRHKDLVSLHERRLRIEESKSEINRQGIFGLVDAINSLSNSILALASQKNQTPPK
ncbi:Myb/SANT-like DNA-binding domain 4 [Dillenia turbinata]|uniref:Myb/SANT-like DNA-binding domain 4 n=1 Tax=Dillenia turbinata TaxID=194707 RepID=A0AAN8UNT6_9MAGN